MVKWVVSALAALLCVGMAEEGLAQSNGCTGNDYRLPTSGLCASAVAGALPPKTAGYEDSLSIFGCRSMIWDAPIMGQVMVYRAAQCGQGRPASFSVGVGAHMAGLDYLGGGLDISGGQEITNFAYVVDADPRDPLVTLTRVTKEAMENSGFPVDEISRCTPRRAPEYGPNAWVVDDPVSARNDPGDGPRYACGTFGYSGDSTAFWQVTQGVAFFFELGQDAYSHLDPASIMIIGKNAQGRWGKMKDIAGATRANTPKPVAWAPKPTGAARQAQQRKTIRQIAGMSGVSERPYAQVRGWNVVAGFKGGEYAYCAGEVVQDGIRFRLGYDGQQWQVALGRGAPTDYQGELVVDGRAWPLSGIANRNWTIGYITQAQSQAIGQGNLLILDIGRASFDLPLRGSAATILKLQECYVEGGVKP